MQNVLRNRNLQLYFGGQVISLIGTWMQQMALSWLVYRLTNSPLMLGLMGFASQVPSLFLTPFAGIIVDRGNRHRLLLLTQTLEMIQATVLAVLVATGHAQLWQLVVLSVVLGIITAFDLPTRQSFLVDMLDDPEQLKSAIGVSSSINTITRLVGPFLAGVFVAYAGEAMCFTANALSYLAVLIALMFVKSHQRPPKANSDSALLQMKEGVKYTFGYAPIRDLVVLLAFFGLFAMPFNVLMPAFAKDVFHGNATTLGFLNGASSVGTVIGAFFLTSRKGNHDLSKWIMRGCILCGAGLLGFGLSTNIVMSLLAVAIAGFGSMILMAGSNTVIQTIVDEDKRGRVMSFVIMAFLGTSPFGCMAAGALANSIGAGYTVVITGVLTLIIAGVFHKRVTQTYFAPTNPEIVVGITETEDELTAISA